MLCDILEKVYLKFSDNFYHLKFVVKIKININVTIKIWIYYIFI